MAYEPVYARFGVIAPDGHLRNVAFKKAGFLAVGDQPEVYFFEVDGELAVVGVSGEALRQVQRAKRAFSREEKIDLAGLQLKLALESAGQLDTRHLYIDAATLQQLANDLGFLK